MHAADDHHVDVDGEALVTLRRLVAALGELDLLQLVDLRACALVGVGDDDGGQLHLVEGNALLLAVGQQIVVVVAEHRELAGRLIVARAVAARLGAGAVDFFHLQLVVVADLLHLNVQAGDFQIHVAPIVGFSVYLQHCLSSSLSCCSEPSARCR